MRLLSFPKISDRQADQAPTDWSQQEVADFYRAYHLLEQNGAGIGMDRGITDMGEPWMVFYDVATQDVFLHVARINRRCVLICDALGIRISAAHISALIADFEEAVHHHTAFRTERSSNVAIHPAAKIIMSVSAVFLLFKLDSNGVVHAKGLSIEGPGSAADALGRKSEYGLSARAYGALGRLLDAVDTPMATAALAGVILTSELLIHNDNAERASGSVGGEIALKSLAGAAESSFDSAPISASTLQPDIMTDTEAAILIAAKDFVVATVANAEVLDGILTMPLDFTGVVPAESPSSKMAAPVVLTSVAQPVVELQEGIVLEPEDLAAPEAEDLLETLFDWTLAITSNGEDVFVAASDAPAEPQSGQFAEVSLAVLDDIDDLVGWFWVSSLAQDDLSKALSHVVSAIGTFDIEYDGKRVLIEQTEVASLAADDIGIWTNVMLDGSSISIIGQRDVMDDLATTVA